MKAEDLIKSANSSAVKGKHGRPSKKTRVLEMEESLKCNTLRRYIAAKDPMPCLGDPFTRREISRKKRKLETNSRQQKLQSLSRNNSCCSLGTEDFKKVGFPIRRKKRRRNGFEKKVMKATIFSWLIDAGMVEENAEVYSMDEISKQMKNRGTIMREGVLCLCCNKVFTVANFHMHGGRNCIRPFENILIAHAKVPLLSYMIEAWKEPKESLRHKFNVIETKGGSMSDIYDDACMICADGGNLMCCEECNSTYHQGCMGMEDVPEGSWYCPYCACKFCAEPSHENDCLLTCPQCEKRYHWECHPTKEHRRVDLNSIPLAPFCEQSCKEVFDKLTKFMAGKRNELGEGYSWTLLHRMDDDFDMCTDNEYLRIMCHSKLSVARRLMEECFEPIQDRHTRIKVIPSVVYNCGANFRRMNFKGFYTAVLEKDDEIISVASLRIHGTKLAEMPFIATNEAHRCKGMCKRLMVAIESALCYLKVENLVIPSVPERSGTWIGEHRFCHLDTSMKNEIMLHSTLMFHDSVRLQKALLSSSHRPPSDEDAKMRDTESINGQKGLNGEPVVTGHFDLNLVPFM